MLLVSEHSCQAIAGTWRALSKRDGIYHYEDSGFIMSLNFPTQSLLSDSDRLKEMSYDQGGEHYFGTIERDGKVLYYLQHEFKEESYLNENERRTNAGNGFHRITFRVNRDILAKRDGGVEADEGNVEASYFWKDWDVEQEKATADHQDQMVDEISKAIESDPNQGHYGTFQLQFYNGEATDDCGYAYFHPVGYSFHGGEAEGYLNQYCD